MSIIFAVVFSYSLKHIKKSSRKKCFSRLDFCFIICIETLEEIFKRLSRHFNVEIQLNNKKHKEYRYRATFRKETLSQILDYLSKSATMKWKIEDSVQQTDDTLTKTKYIVDLY